MLGRFYYAAAYRGEIFASDDVLGDFSKRRGEVVLPLLTLPGSLNRSRRRGLRDSLEPYIVRG